jgi:predicted RNase H-like HicB family nuclease
VGGRDDASWPVRVTLYEISEITMLGDCKIVLYRQEDESWVAEVPAISGCYALMPTRAEALAELENVFQMIADEYQAKGLQLPKDTIAHDRIDAVRVGRE